MTIFLDRLCTFYYFPSKIAAAKEEFNTNSVSPGIAGNGIDVWLPKSPLPGRAEALPAGLP
jgi:hypothetical protein